MVEKIDKKSHGTAYVKHLFASEVPPKHVLGLKVFTEKTNDLGIVKGLYGNTGLLRVQFASSLTKKKILNANDGVILKLRRYIFEQDRTKHLNQDWLEDVTFEDDDDAVRIANESRYGLVGSVHSGSLDRAMAVARRIRAGVMSINGGAAHGVDIPFGGYKFSGIGRQNGEAGFNQYLETKSIAWPIPKQ